MSAAPVPDFLTAARDLAPLVREHRDAIERDRGLPEPLVDAIAATGVWRMLVPAAADGFECDPALAYDVIETIAEADGAAGWKDRKSVV